MAKDISVDKLSENALDSSAPALEGEEKFSVSEKVEKLISTYEDSVKRFSSLSTVKLNIGIRRKTPLSVSTEQYVCLITPDVGYPLSVTDQTHALSISEQIRRGVAQEQEPEKNNFDFIDGKDDGSKAIGIFDLCNRVDAWIAEQQLTEELRDSFRSQVLKQTADKAMKETLDMASNKVSQTSENHNENVSSKDSDSSK